METKTLVRATVDTVIATKNPDYFIVKFKPTVTTSDTEMLIAMFEDKLIDSSVKKLIDDSKLPVNLETTLR
tara:strand:- start:1572 stop:1784 length:213 start_codon:yes stop_codon:yes gene_type:complete